MLLELSALSQVPAAHRVVESPSPQFGPVVGDVDAAGSVSVALELPAEGHAPKTTSIKSHGHKSSLTTSLSTAQRLITPLCSQLPDEGLVVQVPHDDVAVAAAGETDLVVWTDGQRVARRSRGRQLCLDARSGRGQVPDGQGAGFTSDYQSSPIWEELT